MLKRPFSVLCHALMFWPGFIQEIVQHRGIDLSRKKTTNCISLSTTGSSFASNSVVCARNKQKVSSSSLDVWADFKVLLPGTMGNSTGNRPFVGHIIKELVSC